MSYPLKFFDNIKDNQITGQNNENKSNTNVNNQFDSKSCTTSKEKSTNFFLRR